MKLSTEKTKLGVAIKTSERNAKKCLEKVSSLEQEVLEAENDLRKLQERRKEIEEEAMTIKSSQETLEATEEGMKAKLAKLKIELDAALKLEQLPSYSFKIVYSNFLFFFCFILLCSGRRTKCELQRLTTIRKWKSTMKP